MPLPVTVPEPLPASETVSTEAAETTAVAAEAAGPPVPPALPADSSTRIVCPTSEAASA